MFSISTDPITLKPKHCRSEGLEFLKSIPVIERKFNAKGKGGGIGAEFCEGSKPEEGSSEERSEKKRKITPSIELIHPGSHSSGPRNEFTDTMSTASQVAITAKKIPSTTDLIARRKRKLRMVPSDETSTREGLSPPAAKKPPTPVSTITPEIPGATKTDDPQKPSAPDTPSLLLPSTKVKYRGGKGTVALEDACHHAFQVMQSVLFLREQGSEEERATVALVRERDSLTEKVKLLGQELKQARASLDKEKASSDALSKRVCELEQENSELGTKSGGLEEKNAALMEEKTALVKEKAALMEKLLDSTAYYALKGRLELLQERENIPERDSLMAEIKKELEGLFPDGDPLEGFNGEVSDHGEEEQVATSSSLSKKEEEGQNAEEAPC